MLFDLDFGIDAGEIAKDMGKFIDTYELNEVSVD